MSRITICRTAGAAVLALAGVVHAQCFSNRLVADVPQKGEALGAAVDVSGTRAILGAPANDSSGRVVIFERTAALEWSQVASLSSPEIDSDYGRSVTIRGNFAAVGEPLADGDEVPAAGKVYIYRRIFILGNPQWILDEVIDAPSPQQAGRFGGAIDLHENSSGVLTLAVGIPRATVGDMFEAGRVRIFTRATDGTWSLQDSMIATSPVEGAQFGRSVALQGDRLVVGCPYEPVGSLLGGGAVYVFTRSGSDWGTGTRLVTPVEHRTGIDYFGEDVGIFENTIAIGAPNAESGGELAAGAIYVFSRLGSGWVFRDRLTEGNPSQSGAIGDNLAIVDGLIVSGEIGSGRAHAWRLVDGEWGLWTYFTPPSGQPLTKWYGTDVAMSDDSDFLIVGDSSDSDHGAAYAFSPEANPASSCPGGFLDPVPLVEPGEVYLGCNNFGSNDGVACVATNRDVWYRYTPPCDGILALSTCGTDDMGSQDSGIDTVLSVHTGCPGDTSNMIVCNNNAQTGNWPDACGPFGDLGEQRDAAVKVGVTAGQSYRIRIASNGSAGPSGLFRLRVEFTCCAVDWDGNGVVNSTDVSSFINDWFADQQNGTLFTDFDHNGVVNSTDVSNFINGWFVGCEV